MSVQRTRLRICHIASGDVWGGLEKLVLSLVSAQHASPAFRVTLVLLNEGQLAQEARKAGVQVLVVPETGASPWLLYRRLAAVLRAVAPDIVHTHRYKENFYSYLLTPALGLRHVVTLHGFEPPTSLGIRIKVAIRDFVSFRLARRSHTRFAAVSRDLQVQYRVPDETCTVIPNGIPMRGVSNGAAARNGRAPVIGWAGRMVPIKSLGTLLDAVALLSAGGLRPSVLLLGDGPERAALAEQARRLGIAEQIEFAGFVDDPAPHYERMDVFALPSLHEGVPLALLEAMSAGIPVIAADVGGIHETMADSGGAHLMQSHEPAAWATALRQLLANSEETRAMAKRGRAIVAERFSLEAMLERYTQLYRSALGN